MTLRKKNITHKFVFKFCIILFLVLMITKSKVFNDLLIVNTPKQDEPFSSSLIYRFSSLVAPPQFLSKTLFFISVPQMPTSLGSVFGSPLFPDIILLGNSYQIHSFKSYDTPMTPKSESPFGPHFSEQSCIFHCILEISLLMFQGCNTLNTSKSGLLIHLPHAL